MPQSNSSHNGNNSSSPPTSAPASGIPTNWPSYSQQQAFLPAQSHHQVREKRESMSCEKEDKSTVGAGAATLASTSARTLASGDTSMPETSDFVKKLYRMLENPSFQSVVCWGPLGDRFIVKDMNEFTKSILPCIFKHSNFASFVHQLNKYDFHKVKNTDDNQFRGHSSIFRHPDFHAGRRDALENIKRKVPAQRKTTLAAAALAAAAAQQTTGGTTSSGSLPSKSNANSSSSSLPYASNSHSGSVSQSCQPSPSNPSGGSYPAAAGGVGGRSPSLTQAHLTAEIQRLKDEGEDLRGRIRVLERNYENVLVEMVGFQRGMAMMFNFGSASFSSDATDASNNIPMNTIDEHEGSQVYIAGHPLPRNAGGDNMQGSWTFDASGLATGALGGLGIGGVEAAGASSSSALECMYSEEKTVQPTLSNALITTGSSSTFSSSSSSTVSVSGGSLGQKFHVQKSTFVPGWAVPPRVLIVDDDVVTRQLSSKFLKVFGCTTDVAVDGVVAVNKMNLEKYDLVFMDIVMPKLDGVSATNLIRKFDQGTPIISMTSNSKPNEIMTYYSSGMNDILPKPFKKEGLLDMLEKHLMHLKVIHQQMDMSQLGLEARGSIPKNIGTFSPLSNANFKHALMAESGVDPNSNAESLSSSSNSGTIVLSSSIPCPLSPFNFNFGLSYFPAAQQPSEEDEGRINPLAGMELMNEQYNLILQNIVSRDGFLDGIDNLVSSSSSSATPSGSAYASGYGSRFLGSEVSTPMPTIGMDWGDGMIMCGEKRGLEEEGEDQRDGKMKKGRYDVS